MSRQWIGLCLVLCAAVVGGCSDEPAPAPRATSSPPLVSHVVIISIDGCRPDIMLRANTPNIRELMNRGSYSMWARTTEVSITLPSHTTMATGVRPEKHGVTWNGDLAPENQTYPAVPTIFEVGKKSGMSTAMVAGKSKFVTLARPGSIDFIAVSGNGVDVDIPGSAILILLRYQPNIVLVHMPWPDSVGHQYGWGTPEQVNAIEFSDQCVGKVMQGIRDAGMEDKTLVLLTADHGGAGLSHGANDPRSRHIPWIAVGPGVRANYDLTRFQDLTINTEDTFSTACYFLGLPLPGYLDGKPIYQIIEEAELVAPVAN